MFKAISLLVVLALAASIQTLGRGEGICGNHSKFVAESHKQQYDSMRACIDKTPESKNFNSDDVTTEALTWMNDFKKCAGKRMLKKHHKKHRKLGGGPTLNSMEL